MKENPVRFKYVCARALLHIPVSKTRHINHKIQKIRSTCRIAFCVGKRHHADLHYAENQCIPFLHKFVRVT